MKNTMKKISLSLLALTLVPTAAFAETQFQGFYTGAGVGYSRTDFHGSAKASGVGKKSTHKNINGANFDAFFGYGSPIDLSGFYLGGELGFGYDTAHYHTKRTILGHTVRAKMNRSLFYNVAARLGYVICTQTLVYTRIGYQGYQHNIKLSVNGKGNTHTKRDGLILGVGADHALTKTVFLRGEYKYNFGQHSKHKKTNISGIGTVHMRSKAPSHTFLLGLGFKI